MYYLQNRWKIKDKKLVYYGIRRGDNLNKNKFKLTKKQRKIIATLPKELTAKEVACIKKIILCGAVKESLPAATSLSLSEAKFCKRCCANDFIIPGLEFNSDGLCAMCESEPVTKNFKSVVPIVSDIPKSKKSRFDVAVF